MSSAQIDLDVTVKDVTPLLQQLVPALQRLDARLEQAVLTAGRAAAPGVDRFQGLHIPEAEVARLLRQAPGAAAFSAPLPAGLPPLSDTGPLAWLERTFDLTPFDLDLLLLAVAPELDRRYERLYAYLQDHVGRRRPTVDLALHLLCADAAERLARRDHFAPDAPLFRHELLHLLPQGEDGGDTLLARPLRPDEQVLALLLGEPALDRRLLNWATLWPGEPQQDPDAYPPPPDGLAPLAAGAWSARSGLHIYGHGPAGSGRRYLARALAQELSTAVLQIDVPRLLVGSDDPAAAIRIGLRQTWFQRQLLLLHDVDPLAAQPVLWDQVTDALSAIPTLVILTGRAPQLPAAPGGIDWLAAPMVQSTYAVRCRAWDQALARRRLAAPEGTVDALAGRFRLSPQQIQRAAGSARLAAELREQRLADDETLAVDLNELQAAARHHSGQGLAALAQKIEPIHAWEDIVLPADVRAQLEEICLRVAHRQQVLRTWGFGERLGAATGTNALFAGPSGTGKTMAAEIIARELGLDLYRIDLSSVVSKYIGETEKNLERVFQSAENANAILFFDEADALFGKRSEVRDAHDRYANIEISYLLQRMETYDGLTILATNLRHHLDAAFARRMAATVSFPFPDAESREAIWARVWPAGAPLAPDLDLPTLAERHRLSGGHIRNVALAAAFLAAADGTPIGAAHLDRALDREYEKMGRRQPAGDAPEPQLASSTLAPAANGRGTP